MAAAWSSDFRHCRRPVGAYPAANYPLPKALLTLLAVLPFTAMAQQGSAPETTVEAPQVFLSNAGESSAGWTESVLAQGFITGRAAGGYRLGSVELFLERPPAAVAPRPVVSLHADEMGEPGERIAVLTNPESYAAGANRFEAPLPVALNARKAYHLLVNLGADPPLAFGLVFPGKADVPSGDAQWVAQTGSRTLLDNWEWRFNDGFALRFTLHEAGENVPPPPPRLSQVLAASPAAAPSGESEDAAGTPAQAESSPRDEVFGSAPAPIVAQNTPQPQSLDDDDDEAAAPVPRRRGGRTGAIVGAALAGVALIAGSDGDDSPPVEQPSQTTPPDPPPPPPLSDDATLSALAVSDAESTAVALTPMFSSAVTSYAASVGHSMATVSILPMTSHADAELEYLDGNDMPLADADSGTADFRANLVVGANTVKVRVTAEDGEAMRTYAVAIERAIPPPPPPPPLSDDATLSALAVTDSDAAAVTLMPAFSSAVTSYAASVEHAVATVTIVPMTSHADARIEYLDGTDMALADAVCWLQP